MHDFRKLRAALIVAAALFTIMSGPRAQAADYPEPGNFQKGAQTWADNCGRCHNIRGARELRDDQWISTAFHMRVRAGLTGQETRDVLTFLQNSNSMAAPVVRPSQIPATARKPADAATVYGQTCIACHGSNGKGAFPGVPDFTRSDGPLAKADEVLFQHVVEGFRSPGSNMAMPPKGGNPDLSSADVRALVKYLRSSFSQ